MKVSQTWIVIVLSLFVGLALVNSPVDAQESRLSRSEIPLSLADALQRVLEQNFAIRIEQYNPELAREDVRKAEAAFAPALSANSSYARNESTNQNAAQNTLTNDIGFEQEIKTGASYQFKLQTRTSDFETLDTNHSDSLTLTLAQPLLKNRGAEVNGSRIVIAEKNQESSVSRLKTKVIDTLVQLTNTYWELIQARGVLEADRYALQLAYDQVHINEEQVKVGVLAPIEILQAQSTAASREVQIISDEQQVQNLEDQLKQLLNIAENDPLWNAAILPTTDPTSEQLHLSLEENMRFALENREDLQRLRTSLEIREIGWRTTQNQLLPELNVQTTFGLTGNDDAWGGSWGNLADFETYSMNVGLNFRYPLGNQTAKSDYHQAQLEREQTRLSIASLEQQISTQVRQAVRAVETSYRQINASNVARDMATRQLAAEQEKFKEGLSTNFQVLDYQGKLANAQSQYTRALISYNKAIVELEQTIGVTLQRHGVVVK